MFTVTVESVVEVFDTLSAALVRAAHFAQNTNAIQATVCCTETGEIMSVTLLYR